ncbi:DUF4956 domain-containing protein [Clostridium sp. B9]|uniref:DUF4956 domain-containing protein n=1 Tax=Clostridium sp. B9 TaxID=3423224 RepID=UPI003D2EE7A1
MNTLFNLSGLYQNTTEQLTSNASLLASVLVAISLSIILFLTYKHSYNELNYNPKFNVTLVMIAFISTLLMELIKSNLALSLGMLGSLSIVRFRTGVKDPRDIGFVFWSMAIGISSSTHNFLIGFLGSIGMAIFMIATSKVLNTKESLLLVIRGQDTSISLIQDIIDSIKGTNKLKAKNITSDSFEIVYEITLKNCDENPIIDRLMKLDGVDTVNVLAPNTEVV